MKGHFDRLAFKSSVQEMVSGMIRAGLSLHENVTKTFRKTAANFCYEFNIRHMSNVFGGLLSAKPSEFADGEKIVLLWMHESERIYGDRLVSVSDLKKYKVLCFELCKKMFSKYNFAKFFADKGTLKILIFGPFSKGISDMDGGGCYDRIVGQGKLSELLGGDQR